jgi:uncharacterized protein YoxC
MMKKISAISEWFSNIFLGKLSMQLNSIENRLNELLQKTDSLSSDVSKLQEMVLGQTALVTNEAKRSVGGIADIATEARYLGRRLEAGMQIDNVALAEILAPYFEEQARLRLDIDRVLEQTNGK